MKIQLAIALLLSTLGLNLAQAGGNVEAGQALASRCAACHGPEGKSQNPLWPHLAGQQAGYLAKQLKAFRSGERQDPLMSAQAAPLSDEQIADLAAYFSSLQ